MGELSHERVNHEIWRVGLYDLGSLGFADNMALIYVNWRGDAERFECGTMSAPSFALAIAEKYGAPV